MTGILLLSALAATCLISWTIVILGKTAPPDNVKKPDKEIDGQDDAEE